MTNLSLPGKQFATGENAFTDIAADLCERGYSIQCGAVPLSLCEALREHVLAMDKAQFEVAGVGRQENFSQNELIRRDEICWIEGESSCGKDWLNWTQKLQQYLNRQLFLGLFSFESHFAHYRSGAFYRKHVDAFKGESNRILSLVLYLNPQWTQEDGGELLLYTSENDCLRINPDFGTLVTFLSEDFYHEVLAAKRDRYSVAGWFRVNTSSEQKVDPAS